MLDQKPLSKSIALHLVAIIFVIFNISDIKVAGLSSAVPLFDVMMVFYFAVFKDKFSAWFIFLIGLWTDSLLGLPLGVTSFCYIVSIKIFQMINFKLNIKENFQQIWKQFIAFCCLFLFLKWAILSAFNGAPYDFNIILIQCLLTSCFYVVMHKFFDYLSEKLLEDNA